MNIELHGGTIVGDIEIEAQPEAVFDALTTPEDLAAWWGAEGVYRTHDWEIDLRPGGAWNCRATNAAGEMTVHGVYLEVERPRTLAYTWNPSWDRIPTTTVRYTLTRVAAGTRVHFEHSGFDGQLKSQQGHSQGWVRVIEWLAGYLQGKGGGEMRTAILFLLAAFAAPAANFFIVYELAPGVDFTHLTPQQIAIMQQHGGNLIRLRDAGSLLIGGRTQNPQGPRGMAIVVAENQAAAQAIAAADPAVRAGVLRATVEPLDLVFAPPNVAPVIPDSRAAYTLISGFIVAAASKMPEPQYAFRPTPEVRTFAQLLGHIADAHYLGCSAARGEEYKPRDIEKTVSGKPELIAALESAVAYCQETWARTTAQSAAAPVTFFGKPHTRLGLLDLGTAHAFEHYGNLVTYLRLQHIVPPSSE